MLKQINFLLSMLLLVMSLSVHAQVKLGNNPTTVGTSSLLELESNNKAIVITRVANSAAISSPVNGMIIYDVSSQCFKGYSNGGWSACFAIGNSPSTNGNGIVSAYGAPSCTASSISGTMQQGVAVSGVTMIIYANVTALGTYNISTTTNGVTFSASGTFTNLGCQQIILTGSGTPTASGTFTWSTNTTPSISASANVITIANWSLTSIASYNGNSIINSQGVGYNSEALPSGSTITLNVNVISIGNYTVSGTNATSGITYSATGTFSATGPQTIVLQNNNAVIPTFFSGNASITLSGDATNTLSISPRIDVKPISSSATAVVEITSATGKIWMDRNLGARRVATALNDKVAYGNLYQWGRGEDGHQTFIVNGAADYGLLMGGATSILSATDNPGHSMFIYTTATPNDWRSTQNNTLWQGVSGINNPCPSGFRLPTTAEWSSELSTNGISTLAQAYSSIFKLTAPGAVINTSTIASTSSYSSYGYYWSSTVSGASAESLRGSPVSISIPGTFPRAWAMAVRCIKN